jgi:hypothetical protein
VRINALIVGIATSFSVTNPARAEPAAPGASGISIVPSDCEQTRWAGLDWAELLRVELTATGRFAEVTIANRGSIPSDATPSVQLRPESCGAATSATITVQSGDQHSTRTVDLMPIEPVARARALAIAAAELVRSELPVAGATEKSPTRPNASSTITLQVTTQYQRPSVPRATIGGVALIGGLETRIFAKGNAALFGGRAGALFELTHWLFLEADAGALFGGARDALGNVRSSLSSAGVGLLGAGQAGGASFEFGPKAEAGIASFSGRAYEPTTVAETVNSPLILFGMTAAAQVPIAGRLSGLAAFDIGTTLYSFEARADQRIAAAIEGPMFSARIGVAWALGAR